ncbi:natural product biosynthesis luciferase-like monooxygenase domain-containing protein [Methylomagnum ishizawai]|uniref:Natural product biosynthesis luciferase-like monooxygenase domain-containing protein n=1 Tax=Methylomagnum ishizawai TaxID=1760988 RepID=A0A1Y6D4I7_9GAMM|nr:MupA/Atu3671 family FMN-dependent luciferase-like monooxygenase [Methylomagnum ishizawai]SMF97501.1 natural product biosynthesis luciferase-like monooxygenase domain-containing protein [Methylomagnum ishizawai]
MNPSVETADVLTREILELLAATAPESGRLSPAEFAARHQARPQPRKTLDFSIMFFSAAADAVPAAGLYDLLRRAAVSADRLGFAAIWLPERHFHRFGGAYPAPAVLAAVLADLTRRVRLRAGSITLPLDSPIRVAEAWAMVDQLSGGRVDLGFGNGWSPNDFVLAPECFAERKGILRERIEQVRGLWRGEALSFINGEGGRVPVRTWPRPVQAEPPIWIAATGNPETFAWAGAQGFNILTMLLGGTLQDTAGRVRVYREARRAAGLDPAGGRVALMLHTLVHPDRARVMAAVQEPFTRYVRDALDAQRHASPEGRALDETQREQMVRYATERYTRTAALFGPPEDCQALLREIAGADIDEIACLIDFGPETDLVLEALPHLAGLRDQWNGVPACHPAPEPAAIATPNHSPIAIIGMSGSFPGAPDLAALAEALAANTSALRPPPPGRYGAETPALALGGFIDEVEWFDPTPFRLSPAEAAVMDPHQRLLLSAARRCFADAGLSPAAVAGTATGVFLALYSDSHSARQPTPPNGQPDPLAATGRIHALAANRISHVFDLAGPSEVVATACSSGLVAVHRAVQAVRAGECAMALVAAASLLLSDGESRALGGLGILSPEGRCRPFDRAANGQARGEGVCALLLKPLDAALAAGDPIHAVIRGSATNHSGAASGSLLLPNANRQADCMAQALADADVPLAGLGYIEAHGAGGAGDLAELAAFAEVWRRQGAVPHEPGIALASGKAAMGSLDAAGGLAGLARAVLAVREGMLPGLAAGGDLGADSPLAGTPFYLNRQPRPWTGPETRRAGVHAYGLGGVNAHVIVEAPPRPRPAASPPPPEQPLHFPLPPETCGSVPVPAPASVVGDFYDYVTRDDHGRFEETYLTLAPFPEPVPGFSWTRTMQNPAAHPDHARLLLDKQREMRAVAFAPVDFAQARRMLDIGCGLGTDLIVLAETHPQLEGVGYTLSPAQAGAAGQRIAAWGLERRLTVRQGDSARDAFPGRFDLIFGFEVAHHIRDKDGLFANIAGALAPDGVLVLADTVAGTVAPVDLAAVGSYTLPRGDYARLFARHGLEIVDCVDLSQEIANFLVDPQLEAMLAAEADTARQLGRDHGFPLAEAVQRSWDAFGAALREGLMLYVLIHARPALPGGPTLAANLRMMEAA